MGGHRHRLQVGENTIEYTLAFEQRKTLTIRVRPDQSVVVKAPQHTDYAYVESFIKRRAEWIVRKVQEFAARPGPRQFVDGEKYHYLGREVHLRIVQGNREDVRLTERYLNVWTKDTENVTQVERLIENWYLARAQQHFAQRITALMPPFASLGVCRPQVVVRRMKTRWGSSRTNGRISLNTKLMQTPEPCIDYVIIHELCHFIEHNHGPKFYALLERMLPDWRVRRQQLNQYPVR